MKGLSAVVATVIAAAGMRAAAAGIEIAAAGPVVAIGTVVAIRCIVGGNGQPLTLRSLLLQYRLKINELFMKFLKGYS